MLTLTHAPLPKWKYLARIFASNYSDAEIANPWRQADEKFFWFSRSSWSLYAIALYRIKKLKKENILIWVPDYFCNASLKPLRDLGADLQFYPLFSNGKPDMKVCEKMLQDSSPDIIIFVHYFGKLSDSKDLSCLAKNSNAWLVEDCAHCLQAENGIGTTGDFVLYSQHKSLPLSDGALLLIRNNGPSNLASCHFELLHRELTATTKVAFYYGFKWLVKRFLQKIGIRSGRASVVTFDDIAGENSVCLPGIKMSNLAKKLLMEVIPGMDMEKKARKRNAQQWRESLGTYLHSNLGITPIFENYTPYLAGFKLSSKQQTEEIFYFLQDANVPVTTWPDLPPEVLGDNIKHKMSIEMRNTRLFFPVHSSITPQKIKQALDCIQ